MSFYSESLEVSLKVLAEAELARRASAESGNVKRHEDGSSSFYSKEGIGLAIEWVWRPGADGSAGG